MMLSARVNREYLDAALASIDDRVQSSLKREEAYTALITADSQATVDRARAELNFRTLVAKGIRILLILVGIGILIVLTAFAVSLVLAKLRTPLSADRLAGIDAITTQNQTSLDEMARSIEYLASKVEDLDFGSRTIVVAGPNDPTSLFSIPKFPFDPGSDACINGGSYAETCIDRKILSNGMEYYGEWQNGVPNGSGTLSFKDGGALEGQWQVGSLISVAGRTATEAQSGEYLPILSVPKVPYEEGSSACPGGVSYTKTCSADQSLPNGSIFSGEWRDGVPNGRGRISFQEGGTIDGQWRDGTLISVEEQSVPETKTIRSVTYFESISADDINSKFGNIDVGHRFESSADETWTSAYCYLMVYDGRDELTVSLSRYDSFNSELALSSYQTNGRYSAREFRLAQDRCPYRRIGFR